MTRRAALGAAMPAAFGCAPALADPRPAIVEHVTALLERYKHEGRNVAR